MYYGFVYIILDYFDYSLVRKILLFLIYLSFYFGIYFSIIYVDIFEMCFSRNNYIKVFLYKLLEI